MELLDQCSRALFPAARIAAGLALTALRVSAWLSSMGATLISAVPIHPLRVGISLQDGLAWLTKLVHDVQAARQERVAVVVRREVA